jgi:hypothetical protein
LSGFCGFDFIIEDSTRAAYLIEMNARATPLCHLAVGSGECLATAMSARLLGLSPPRTVPATGNDIVAYFPQAWLQEPDSELLYHAYHDVPWDEPGLVRELVRPPWPERGRLARLFQRVKK